MCYITLIVMVIFRYLKVISPHVIVGNLGYCKSFHLNFIFYCKLFHRRLFLAIISNSNIWLLVAILLMAIGCSFIGVIGGLSINGY